MALWELLELRRGITAVIGGGGKTSLLAALGRELSQHGRVALCTTTKILPFPDVPWVQSVKERPESPLLCVGTPLGDTGKLTAPEEPLAALAEVFDYVLVEADGAAGRPLKAHAPWEPVIPPGSDQTICVVGVTGFGRPIREAAHRPERYGALAGANLSDPATPETEAAVLRAEGLHHRLYINQAETAAALAAAERLAALAGCPAVAGSLWRGAYQVCRQ